MRVVAFYDIITLLGIKGDLKIFWATIVPCNIMYPGYRRKAINLIVISYKNQKLSSNFWLKLWS